jgi:signal transduction histidine kinase
VLIEREIEHPEVTVSAFTENGKAVVVIGDNGGGIAEEDLDRVFDPYFSTKEEGKGTGIGLYMSKTIIEQSMAGKLSAHNTPDGAEFRIEVPYES